MTNNQILTFYILETGRGIFRVINSECEMRRAVCLAQLACAQKILILKLNINVARGKNHTSDLYWFSLGHKLFRLERYVYCQVPGMEPTTGFSVTHHGDGAEVMAVGTERKDVIADTLRVLYKTNNYDAWAGIPLLPGRTPVAEFSLDGKRWYCSYQDMLKKELDANTVKQLLNQPAKRVKAPVTSLLDA